MLLSHKHRFIFLKIKKTAGTSIEISLSRYCDGPDDIITDLAPADQALRDKLLIKPKNRLAHWHSYRVTDAYVLITRGKRKRQFWGHMPAVAVRERVGAEVWNSYFKFAIDRNPWDKTISNYYWRCRGKTGRIDLDEYFRRYTGRFNHYNFPVYSIHGAVAVDFVGRYENLIPDLTNALQQVGIEFDGWLPRAKGAARIDRRHYSEVLNEQQREIISSHFRAEVDLLGYRFEERRTVA